MPNALYDKARQSFLDAEIKWSGTGADTIRVALVSSAYSPDLANHQHLDDISESAIIQTSVPLENKTSDKGVADASDVAFTSDTDTAVPAGEVRAIVIYQQGASQSTSRLIAYLDQINGLPITTTGDSTNITIHWDNGPNKIFKL